MVPKRKLREVVVQLLYSFDLNCDTNLEETFKLLLQSLVIRDELAQVAQEKVMEVLPLLVVIDEMIAREARGYAFKRISRVECSILRLSIFELLYDETIPPKVSIAEAVRLSRKFGTKEGGNFVNGVLDAVYREKKEPKLAPLSDQGSYAS